MNFIDSENFDTKLLKILKTQKGKNIASGRFDIENIELLKKHDFIVLFLQNLKLIKGITYKILFWEKDDILIEFFNLNLSYKKFDIRTSYKDSKFPGVLFVNDKEIDEPFLRLLLENHFNHEMVKEPALNLRVQVCINQENLIIVLDIYDDRGFNIYYITNQ